MDLSDLNEKQKEAVLARGMVRIVAGPGSGKTRVLTNRIGYLISECGVNPSNILSVTFTRKAAFEMKERLKELIGSADALNCGTFHSICLRILKENSNGNRFSILDEKKRKRYLKRILGPGGINLDLEPGRIGSIISLAKNRLLDADGFVREVEEPFMRKVARIFSLYEQWKERDRLLDYDDLLLRCWKLLKTDKRVLRKYRQKFSHILVDEFQDTNLAQFEIIRLLVPPQNNLFVVGDDWQAIYGWRGAVPENIIEFNHTFPNATTIKLEQNYRSTRTIVQTSNKLISFNKMRTEKKVWTENGRGREVKVLKAEGPEQEASFILQELTSLVKSNGTRYRDIVILYRTNAQSRALEDECIRQKIPYQVVGSLGFYDRREIKDMIAYLRIIHDLDNDEALLRIINVPSRYLGRAFVRELERHAVNHKQSLFVSLGGSFSRAYMRRKAVEFQELILELRQSYEWEKTTLPDLVKKIRARTDYDAFICKDEEVSPDDSRIQNLNELEAAISRFERIEDFLFYVDQLKKSRTDQTNQGNQTDQISLMTLHKSKGLEFAVVFIAGCAQGLLPHQRAIDDGGIEEERRLCYVGMTRAMERLYISYPRTYQGKQLTASQFLEEAFPDLKTTD